MSKRYYTLVGLDKQTTKWGIIFGDYDRECVEYERDEVKADDLSDYSKVKIITTKPDQKSIDDAVNKLNEGK